MHFKLLSTWWARDGQVSQLACIRQGQRWPAFSYQGGLSPVTSCLQVVFSRHLSRCHHSKLSLETLLVQHPPYSSCFICKSNAHDINLSCLFPKSNAHDICLACSICESNTCYICLVCSVCESNTCCICLVCESNTCFICLVCSICQNTTAVVKKRQVMMFIKPLVLSWTDTDNYMKGA